MVVVERRHLEVVVLENRHLEIVIAGDGHPELVSEEVEDGHLVGDEDGQLEVGDRHLDQSMHLELLPQTTCYPYSWHMVIDEDGQLVVLVVEERHPELVLEEVGNRKKHEPPF